MKLHRHPGISCNAAWRMRHKLMQVMMERDREYTLTGQVQLDDACLGGERSAGKRGRGAPGKTPFVAAVETNEDGHPLRVKLTVVEGLRLTEIVISGPTTGASSRSPEPFRRIFGFSQPPPPANDRVMDDLGAVLGPHLEVLRGDLDRPSLSLQTIRLPRQSERLAWLAERLPVLSGHGIIYTLTIRDAHRVSEWLQSRGLAVEPCTGQTGECREELEQALLANRVKALAATTALRRYGRFALDVDGRVLIVAIERLCGNMAPCPRLDGSWLMSTTLSSNTQAILLLTAPLVAGQGKSPASPLSPVEYNRLARWLQKHGREPADLVSNGGWNELKDGSLELDRRRLGHLLGRGFSLGQAVKRWQARAIRVVSRADVDYPRRLKNHLGVLAPPLLCGCGERAVLDGGGLAVVGSRNVSDELIGYTEDVGRLAAKAHRSVVSGGARGIDRAAMRGALEAGGVVAGILADSLERAVMRREHREALMSGRLVLISPYDPAARFHVGHAMQRNKLIYALADAALVVSSDYGKGGTWTGAVEQLEKLRFVPVYVRADGKTGKGLDELRRRGARPWPNPTAPETLRSLLA